MRPQPHLGLGALVRLIAPVRPGQDSMELVVAAVRETIPAVDRALPDWPA